MGARFFTRRSFLLGASAVLGIASSFAAAEWESTISPFTQVNTAELRPLHAQYNFGWNGITAANCDVRLTRTTEGQFRLETNGATSGMARTLWKFDVNNVSLSDARTLRPVRVQENEITRKRTIATDLTFTPERVTSHAVEDRAGRRKEKTRTFDFPNVMSLNSAMLYLRAKPLAEGAIERFVVYPGTSPYLCTLSVLGRERVTVPAGSYDALKAEVQLSKIGKNRELEAHKKFKRAFVWLTNDPDHLVLRIEAQVFVGNVFAELQSVQFENAKP